MNEPVLSASISSEVDTYLRLLSSVLQERGAAYVGVPITTGARFLQWHASFGAQFEKGDHYAAAHRSAVIEPNCADASRRISALRKTLPLPLIDPSSFDRPGWSQDTYHSFWTAVIRRYAAMVVFLDGWQFSNGCAYEFLTAITAGLTVLKEDLSALSRQEGYQLLAQAAAEYRRQHLSPDFLEEIIRALGTDTKFKPAHGGE